MQRARGVARLGVRRVGAQSRLIENFQSGSAKLRFPRSEANEPFAAVLVNTAGGLTGGDRFSWSIDVQAEASATVASQAAERIYRRSAGHAQIETTLTVAEGAALEWLPQETILFDRSALRRTLTVDLTPSSRLLAVESIILGRTAMGESAKSIELTDSWRIRRGGRLVFADGLRLDGDTTAILAGGATGGKRLRAGDDRARRARRRGGHRARPRGHQPKRRGRRQRLERHAGRPPDCRRRADAARRRHPPDRNIARPPDAARVDLLKEDQE